MHKIKQKNEDRLWLGMCIAIFIALQMSLITLERHGLTLLNGVISALQYGSCLLMLRRKRRVGISIAIVLMTISIVLTLRTVVLVHNISAIPGLLNSIFYIITLAVIANYHNRREKENITDVLTGVLNRRGLYTTLLNLVENGSEFSVIYISVDNFKFFNDTYGHAYGDELLREISRRITDTVGPKKVVSRIAGADFVIAVDNTQNAREMANELLKIIRKKTVLKVDDSVVDCYITCYAGVASYPKDTMNYETLIQYADIATYEALSKKNKKANVFNEKMAETMNSQIEAESLIKTALEDGLFYLMYQPQYHLNEKRLRGFESLLRLKTADGNKVNPGSFIPVAERSDLILKIDDYVMRLMMNEFKDIVAKNSDLTISVNVSAKNIASGDFVDRVRKILKKTEYPATNLEIEITEYCMVDSIEATINTINRLRAMGIKIALDDFGTGYTSLNYLAKLPIDLLKIDKSLVDDIELDDKNRKFVRSVISMGHLMDCEVIAEGVESVTQLDYLKEDGCNFVQGFVWGKPLEYERARQLCESEV